METDAGDEAAQIHQKLVKPVHDKEKATAEHYFLEFMEAAIQELDAESFEYPEDWIQAARQERQERLRTLKRKAVE